MKRLMHDVAWATAHHVIEVFNLRDEEKCEALKMVYERIKAGLEFYALKSDRMSKRMKPSQN